MLGASLLNTQIVDQMSDHVINHILKLQEALDLRDSGTLFVINCEANMPYAAPTLEVHLREKVAGRFNYVALQDDRRSAQTTLRAGSRSNDMRAIVVTAGTRTDNASKVQMVHTLTHLLKTGHARFHRRFTTIAPDDDLGPVPTGFEDLRSVIERQLRQFRRRHLPPAKGEETVRYSKVRYEGAEDDDVLMALMLTLRSIDRSKEIPAVMQRIVQVV